MKSSTVALLVVALTALAGCASRNYNLASDWPVQPTPQLVAGATSGVRPLVIVRFASHIEESQYSAALADYASKQGDEGWLWNDGLAVRNGPLVPSSLRSALLKSSDNAFSLVRCLERVAGSQADYVLEPSAIAKRNEKWAYSSRARPLPATVVIDQFYYVAPYSSEIVYSTFAKRERPKISMRVSPAASPTTKGAAIVDELWFSLLDSDLSGKYSVYDARAGLGASLPEFLNTPGVRGGISPVSPWKAAGSRLLDQSVLSPGFTWTSGKVTGLPSVRLRIDVSDGGERRESTPSRTCMAVARMVDEIVSSQPVRFAEAGRLSAYGHTLSEGAVQEGHREIIEKFYQAEVAFLKAQDRKLLETIDASSWTANMNSMRADELKADREFDIGQTKAVLAGLVGIAAPLTAAGNLTRMQSSQQMVSLSNEADARAGVAADGIAGSYETMPGFSFEVTIAGQTIVASTHAEFRQRLRQILRTVTSK